MTKRTKAKQPRDWASGPIRDRAWVVFLAVGLLAIAAYLLISSPGAKTVIYDGIGFAAGVAIIVGQAIYRPRARAGWVLIGAGILLFSAGDVVWGILEMLESVAPNGSVADILYIVGYVAIALGILRLVRARIGGKDRDALIDALIIAVGITFAIWEGFIQPSLADSSASFLGKLVTASYPLADVVLLVVLARLALAPGRRRAAIWLLVSGVAVMLIADLMYATYAQLGLGGPDLLDCGWLLAYLLMGTAALHPAMSKMTEQVPASTHPNILRIALLPAGIILSILILLPGGASRGEMISLLVVSIVVTARLVQLSVRADDAWGAERRAETSDRRAAVAEGANREKALFLSRSSHELRTPLNAVLGFGQYLQMERLSPRQAEAADQIVTSGRALLALIEQILDASRLTEEPAEVDKVRIALPLLVAEVSDDLRLRAQTQQVELRTLTDTDLLVLANRERLVRVIESLMSTALELTQPGWVVTARVRAVGSGVELAIVETEDRLDEVEIDRFLEVVDALEGDVPDRPVLGAAFASATVFMEAHGGTLTATGLPNLGLAFRLTLPSVPPPDVQPRLVGALVNN